VLKQKKKKRQARHKSLWEVKKTKENPRQKRKILHEYEQGNPLRGGKSFPYD